MDFSWIISSISEWRKSNLEKRLRAIDALTPAVAASIAYTTRLRQGEPADLSKEDELHALWYGASSGVSPLDRELAKSCLEKAKYWPNPSEYHQHKIIELNISLVKMAAILESLKH